MTHVASKVGEVSRIDAVVIFLVALGIRLILVLTSRGGFSGDIGYDAGVYYSSAVALIHGTVPYSQFTLLHPPGVMLSLTPFAVLGQLTSDHIGFLAANIASSVLGSFNAVLVLRVAAAIGATRRAQLAGALFYAIWFGAVQAEFLIRLEPLGNLAALCALLALARRVSTTGDERRARFLAIAAGAAFGFAICVKIWWAAPAVVAAVWISSRVRTSGAPGRLPAGWPPRQR